MVRPSVAASTSPTRANSSSRSPGTTKLVLLAAAAAGAPVPASERVTDPAGGNAIAPSALGRSRSGGTSSGRDSGLCAYRSLVLLNHLQPVVPRTAKATTAMATVRMRSRELRIGVAPDVWSGRDGVAAGLFDGCHVLRDARSRGPVGFRKRQQRQPQPMPEAEGL